MALGSAGYCTVVLRLASSLKSRIRVVLEVEHLNSAATKLSGSMLWYARSGIAYTTIGIA